MKISEELSRPTLGTPGTPAVPLAEQVWRPPKAFIRTHSHVSQPVTLYTTTEVEFLETMLISMSISTIFGHLRLAST